MRKKDGMIAHAAAPKETAIPGGPPAAFLIWS